jgi:ADP-ribose pyrophosphatase
VKPDSAQRVWEGKLLAVTLERWGEYEREIVEHPGAVVIVAVDRDECVALVRQLREATVSHSVGARLQSGSHSGFLLELPAGTLEPGESPLETAQRELAEETGLTGGEWREAAAFWTTPGFCRERMTLFYAEGVQAGAARPEADEKLEVVRWPVTEIEPRLGEIEDAKTLAGLLLYLRDSR